MADILSAEAFKELFLLEPHTTFLNHGSFGATPKPVFEVYQGWQRRLEQQPVRFFRDELSDLLASARGDLAAYLNTKPADLVFLPNVTFGVNAAAHALPLGPGDEVLSSDQEYGACDNVWRHLAERRCFDYKKVCLPLPSASDQEVLEHLWSGVTERTKVIFLSHITSTTAQTLPVKAICERARTADILTIVRRCTRARTAPARPQRPWRGHVHGQPAQVGMQPQGCGLFTRASGQAAPGRAEHCRLAA